MQEVKCYKLTTMPIPHSPVLLGGVEVEDSGVKLSLGRKEVFVALFLCPLSCPVVNGLQFNLPKV